MMDISKQKWIKIIDYPEYEVSEYGLVRRMKPSARTADNGGVLKTWLAMVYQWKKHEETAPGAGTPNTGG